MKQLTLIILLTLAATLAHPQSYDFTVGDKTFPESINYASKEYTKTVSYTGAPLRALLEAADSTGRKIDRVRFIDESHSCDDCFNISSAVYTSEQSSESITFYSSKCGNISFLIVHPLGFFAEYPTYMQQYEATLESMPLIKLAFPEAFSLFN